MAENISAGLVGTAGSPGNPAGQEFSHGSSPAVITPAARGPGLQFVATDVTVGGKTKHTDSQPEAIVQAAAESAGQSPHSYELTDIALPDHGVPLRDEFAGSMSQAQASPDAVRTALQWWKDIDARGGTVDLTLAQHKYSIPNFPQGDTAHMNSFLNACHAKGISNRDVNAAINFYFQSMKRKK